MYGVFDENVDVTDLNEDERENKHFIENLTQIEKNEVKTDHLSKIVETNKDENDLTGIYIHHPEEEIPDEFIINDNNIYSEEAQNNKETHATENKKIYKRKSLINENYEKENKRTFFDDSNDKIIFDELERKVFKSENILERNLGNNKEYSILKTV